MKSTSLLSLSTIALLVFGIIVYLAFIQTPSPSPSGSGTPSGATNPDTSSLTTTTPGTTTTPKSGLVTSAPLTIPNSPWKDTVALDRMQIFPPPAGFSDSGNIKAIMLQGANFKNKSTRIFCYVGVPKSPKPVPGIILVHGGGGSSFRHWVKMWNDRGFAAIAADNCGHLPSQSDTTQGPVHAWSGPNGWGDYESVNEPITDQWMFHAVDSVIRSHNYLRSLPGVDTSRIGITGISWGGVISCTVAGVDPRLAFAAHVYGSGGVQDSPTIGIADPNIKAKWAQLWDPNRYIGNAKCEMIWIGGKDDFAFKENMVQATVEAAKNCPKFHVCMKNTMPHGHGPGEQAREVALFADAVVNNKPFIGCL